MQTVDFKINNRGKSEQLLISRVKMKNIMVTDVSYDESEEQECVCVFTEKMTLDQIQTKLDKNPRVKYTDIYEVDDNDLQFYVFEAIWE